MWAATIRERVEHTVQHTSRTASLEQRSCGDEGIVFKSSKVAAGVMVYHSSAADGE